MKSHEILRKRKSYTNYKKKEKWKNKQNVNRNDQIQTDKRIHVKYDNRVYLMYLKYSGITHTAKALLRTTERTIRHVSKDIRRRRNFFLFLEDWRSERMQANFGKQKFKEKHKLNKLYTNIRYIW